MSSYHKMQDKKMKVCFVFLSHFPATGGIAGNTMDLVKALSKKVTVQIVCTHITSQKDIPSSVEVYPILKLPKIRVGGYLIPAPLNLILLLNFLRKKRPHIVHAHFAFPNGFFSLPAKLLGIPIICTSRGIDIQIDQDIGYGLRRNKFMAKLIGIVIKSSSVHTVVSKHMIKDAINAGSNPSKIRVVYNGIDLNKIPLMVQSNILQRYGITKDDFVVLYLGRLHAKKCPADLAKAFPRIIERVPNAKLIFACEGGEEIRLNFFFFDLHLNDKVIFTGFVSGDDKWSLFKRCNIFVLPSAVEAFGIAVIEAMACEKPIIATNLGPFPEIIRDGETGLLVPLHSRDDLADAIIELALDEGKRKEMGKMARKDVEERFDINKIADDYLRVYKELLNKNKKVRTYISSSLLQNLFLVCPTPF